jgi:small-conductance mechanosensitive channel
MNIQELLLQLERWAYISGLHILIILVLAFAATRIVKFLSHKTFLGVGGAVRSVETQKRAETLGSVLRHILNIAIFAVAALTIVKEVGIDIGPILAAAGVVGLAVGFGAQDLVRDFVSGFFILLEDQIRVGDVVVLGDKGGAVEKVNLRMVVLRDLEGNVHYVRNGQISVVTNKTKEYSRYIFDVGVAYREDVDEVIRVMKEVDEEMRADSEDKDLILEPLEILGLDKFADSSVVVKGRTKTTPGSQWRVGREFNRRLKKVFDARDIEIPFPHVTLYMGKDKQGQAPPLRLQVDQGLENKNR